MHQPALRHGDVLAVTIATERKKNRRVGSVEAVMERQSQELKGIDLVRMFDHRVVDQLVREKYFENVFGPTVRDEQQRKQALAYGR